MLNDTSDRCVNCSHDKNVCKQLKGCIVENDKNFDDEQEALERSYLQGQIDTIEMYKNNYKCKDIEHGSLRTDQLSC